MCAIVPETVPSSTIRIRARTALVQPGLLRCVALGSATILCAALIMHRSGLAQAVPMAAILIAAAVSSVAGFAFSAVAGAMLFHLMPDPVQVVHVMIACSIVNQLVMTWAMRRDVDWGRLSVFLAGGLAGLPMGVWVLLHADKHAYTEGLGVFLAAYGLWMLLRRPLVLGWRHPLAEFAVGMAGGVTGGAAGFPGAAMTIWCGSIGLDKSRQRALTQPFILLMQVAALIAIAAAGARSSGAGLSMHLSELLFLPGSVLGTILGLAVFRRLSDTQFARTVNLLLIVSGLSYLA